MAVVISAMAPPSLRHDSSRLSRASSSCAMPPPPPALAKKDAPQDTLFTDEEFQALMSGQCELLSFSDNDHLQSSAAAASPLLSVQLQAQMLCRDVDDDACARFQEPLAAVFGMDTDDDLDAPSSDEDIERVPPLFSDEEIQQALFCDEDIQALCAAPQEASSMPRSDDHQAGKKRLLPSSPPWPSCIADDDDGEVEEAGPSPPLALPFPPLPKKARTQTKRRCRLEHGPRALPPLPPPPPTPIKKAARFQTKSGGSSREHAATARAIRRQQRDLRKWHKTIATRILARQFRPAELSRRRTALRCQCPELALEPRGLDCCALHQEVLPGHRAWMYSADQGHGAPPLVGGPGVVLAPSAGNSKVMVLQYARWRRSVTLPTRFYVQHAVEKRKGLAQQQFDLDDDLTMLPEY